MPPFFFARLMRRKVGIMTQTNAARSFEKELEAVYALIDTKTLKNFLYNNAEEIVGVNRGQETTLAMEIGEVAKMAHRAYIADGVNYYRSFSAFNSVEGDSQERSERMYERAAKKLLFINAVCRSYTGESFLKRRIDKSDIDDCKELVDVFEFCVRNYAEI